MEPSLPASLVITGLQNMLKRIDIGDQVRVQVAVDGGTVWKNGVVLESYPDSFGRRKYDVAYNGPVVPVVLRVNEISIRRA